MKKLVLLAILSLTPCVTHAESMFDKFRSCTSLSVQYTEIAELAAITPDDKANDFKEFIINLADISNNKKAILYLGELAWLSRKVDTPTNSAMKLYDICIKKSGQET